jgi:hypothetical protein
MLDDKTRFCQIREAHAPSRVGLGALAETTFFRAIT